MHHLLLGIDPMPARLGAVRARDGPAVRARRASSACPRTPGARVYVLPCIAGHVGADTAGVILAEAPHRADRTCACVVDVGTNAEIVLGNRDRLLAASSPTGPAFEGAQISAGQRAAPGAIERVRIDRETLEPRFRVIGVDAWSDDPGFAERRRRAPASPASAARASSRSSPSCSSPASSPPTARSTGRWPRARRASSPTGGRSRYVLHDGRRPPHRRSPRTTSARSSSPRPRCTPASRLLMDHAGRRDGRRRPARRRVRQPDRPAPRDGPRARPRLRPRPRPGGRQRRRDRCADRAAVRGAARREIERVVREVEKIETAVEPRFQAHFVDAMAFPHRTAPSTAPVAGRRAAARRRRARRPDGADPRRRDGRPREPPSRSRGRSAPRGGPMTDDGAAPPDRRPGGTRRRARARTRTSSASPFLTRTLKPVRGPRRGGPRRSSSTTPTRSSRRSGIEFRGDPEALAAAAATPAPTSRASACASRAGCAARSSRRRRRGSSPSTPATPSEPSSIGDPYTVLAPELRLAVRARPRQRPPLRDARGLPELREARPT